MGILLLRSSVVQQVPATGLDFPLNDEVENDIALVWDGANLLSRTDHTAIGLFQHKAGNGYRAWFWHSPNTGTWDSGAYSYGTHPFPCGGGYNGSGYSTGGTGGSGTEQFFEIAGVTGPVDKIAVPMEPALECEDATWYAVARTCETISGGTEIRHRFYPDVINAPGDYIEDTRTITGISGAAGSTPAFYLGASDWRQGLGGGGNPTMTDEALGAVVRGIRLFDAALSITDIQAEIAAIGSNTPASVAGAASVWYINDNPTPADVTDKSGEGHDPEWRLNAAENDTYLPGLWEE